VQSSFPAIVQVAVDCRRCAGSSSSLRCDGYVGGPKHLHGGHRVAKPHDAPRCALELHIFIFRGTSRTNVSQFVCMIADGSSCHENERTSNA
jgi:hypothetical protein